MPTCCSILVSRSRVLMDPDVVTEDLVPWLAAVLRGRDAAGGPPETGVAVPGTISTQALFRLVSQLRITGLTWAWSRRERPDLVAHLDASHRRTQLHTLATAEAGHAARAVLSDAGVESVLFKGAALVAQGAYSDPGERPMDDADVLIRRSAFDAASRALIKAGWRPWSEPHSDRPAWSDSLSFSAPRGTAFGPRAVSLDLHWRTEFGALRFGAGGSFLWEAADLKQGRPEPGRHLVVVAEHFLKHLRVKPHLLAYADLVRLCSAGPDWDAVERRAAQSWWAPAIGLVLTTLQRDLGAPVPKGLAERLLAHRPGIKRHQDQVRPAAIVQRVLRANTMASSDSDANRADGLRARWALRPGFKGVLDDLVSVGFPPDAWLRARYGEASSWALRWRHARAVTAWVQGRGGSPLSPAPENAEETGAPGR